MYTLRDLGIWDIIYEHCGYFNHNSLRYLFTACGFEILKLQSDFDGQFLCVEARPVGFNGVTDGLSDEEKRGLSNYINSFSEKYLNKINDWDTQLNQMKRLNEKTVIWGGGSKGVTFLNVLKNFETVKYVVDINPHKQGKFVPGTGQKIVDPKFLAEIKPEFIIIMNPNYLSEIKFLAGQLNLSSQFLIV
jgi:hypothetical protein